MNMKTDPDRFRTGSVHLRKMARGLVTLGLLLQVLLDDLLLDVTGHGLVRVDGDGERAGPAAQRAQMR